MLPRAVRASELNTSLSKVFPVLARSPTTLEPGSKPLGLPRVLFTLYVCSTLASLTLLLLSLLDLGYLSLWIVPPLSLFTLSSHLAFPILAKASRTEAAPSYFSTLVVFVYAFAIAWFIAFVATFTIGMMKGHYQWNLQAVEDNGGIATPGSQIAQILFSALEAGLLAMFAFMAHRQVLDTGEPESWKPPILEDDKKMIGLSTVSYKPE